METPTEFFVAVGSDGSFALGLPDAQDISKPLTLTVLGPGGEVLASHTIGTQAIPSVAGSEETAGLEIPVIPRPARPSAPDPFAGPPLRLRGRVLHAEGQRTVSHRQVLIFAHRQGDGPAEDYVVLATRTDSDGYFFGEYRRPPDTPLDRAYAMVGGAVDLSGSAAIPIPLDGGRLPKNVLLVARLSDDPVFDDECACHAPLPRAPDHHDLVTSSAYSADLGGKCVNLTVPNRALEEFSFYSVVRTTDPELLREHMPQDDGTPQGAPRPLISNTNPVPWEWQWGVTRYPDFGTNISQAATISHGHLLQFKQTWRADGYSLGDLLYSLPLAPLQKKEIAVLDWERRDQASRMEALDESEALQAQLSRDRDINEIITSTLDQHSDGGSKSINIGASQASGASGSGSFGFLNLGGTIASAFGGGWAQSDAWQSSSRDLAMSSLNQLRDRTMQSASATRSQRATVIQTVSQGESSRVQTEVVANHNHCHAVTMEYFEVLRHFQVTQELVDVKECLFVPLKIAVFDEKKVLRWRELLEGALLDPSLRPGFDAIDRLTNFYYGPNHNPLGFANDPLDAVEGEMMISLEIPRPKDKADGSFRPSEWKWIEHPQTGIRGFDAAQFFETYLKDASPAERDEIFRQMLAGPLAAALVADTNLVLLGEPTRMPPGTFVSATNFLLGSLVSTYQPDTPLLVTFQPNPTPPDWINKVRRATIQGLKLVCLHANTIPVKYVVHSLALRYHTGQRQHLLLSAPAVEGRLDDNPGIFFPTPLDPEESFQPEPADQLAARRLLRHLNEHIEYYHRALWWYMDPDRRYILLDRFLAPDGGGRSVASVVENRLAGIVGNALVLPLGPGIRLDPSFRNEGGQPADLLSVYQPDLPAPAVRISVPTRGVFAEAVMGSCNSCEIKDETRFWRFEEAPTTDEPTAIQEVSTNSRKAAAPDLQPADFAEALVKLQTVPDAPEPGGMAAALSLLGQSGLFRDITGLDETQKNALAALTNTLSATQSFGKNAAELAGQQMTMGGGIDKMMESIKKARDDGKIDDKSSRELMKKLLLKRAGGKPGTGGSGKPKPATEDSAVTDAVHSTTASGKGKVKLVKGGRTVSAETDSSGDDGSGDTSSGAGSSDDNAEG